MKKITQKVEETDLWVFITHFDPPRAKIKHYLRDFIIPRISIGYVRSWLRLFRHGTRGFQPWKKDIMTLNRRKIEKSRLRFLNNQILMLSQMNLSSLKIFIHTNSESVIGLISENWTELDISIIVHNHYNKINVLNNSSSFQSESSPWHLTWEHKKSFLASFEKAGTSSIFLAIEDDHLFTETNLEYFLDNKDRLAPLRLIPSFLQIEFSEVNQHYVSVGLLSKEKIPLTTLPQVLIEDDLFVQLPNPYSGLIILDYPQAKEYVSSIAFSEFESRQLTWWGIGERAMMGLQFIDPPKHFSSRNVLPVNKSQEGIKTSAWIIHQPNLYVQKQSFARGLTPAKMFLTGQEAQ